ncbi:MAG: hypothetical protein QOG09_1657 [Solirubrobacterales bacterium]|jgi:hypothetical protein|nr:hypothetical protein [Solirubrobacterales bacterium]MDX6663555.1 hypothetical protein [Solirubrobacterales bacterium]
MSALLVASTPVESRRLQIVAIVIAVAMLLIVFELVRRRRLVERYALIWMLSTGVLLVLAGWRGGLAKLADLLGIAYPPNALFLVAGGFVLLTLLHFSVAISRLSEETKMLAQELARLDQETREARS